MEYPFLSAQLLTQLPETTNQPSKPEIMGGSAKPSNTKYFLNCKTCNESYNNSAVPAMMTSPALTTITDITGVTIYLELSTYFLMSMIG
jgi:hypothetical protein